MMYVVGYKYKITGVGWMTISERVRVIQNNLGRLTTKTSREERAQMYINEGTTLRSYKGVTKAQEPLIKPSKNLDNLN